MPTPRKICVELMMSLLPPAPTMAERNQVRPLPPKVKAVLRFGLDLQRLPRDNQRMCGRFTLKTSPTELAQAMDLVDLPQDLGPRLNIAPGQFVLAIRNDAPTKAIPTRWGLVPSWAANPSIGNKLINARSESAAQKPSFRQALRGQRCLVPADGFYEWRVDGKLRTPQLFEFTEEPLFALAALWQTWQPADGSKPLETLCLLTTRANAVVATVHDRMPVIIAKRDRQRWLSQDPLQESELKHVFLPYPTQSQTVTPVTRKLNGSAWEPGQSFQRGDPRLQQSLLPDIERLPGLL